MDDKKTDIKDDAQSSDSDDEADRVPLTRLRPNRNRPMLCDSSFGPTNRTSHYPTRSNRSFPPSRSTVRETNFQPRNVPTFRPRNNRNEKPIGKFFLTFVFTQYFFIGIRIITSHLKK